METSVRWLLTCSLCFGLIACSSARTNDAGAVAAGESAKVIRYRRNIDDLSQQELQAYEHAIQILKDRSETNPYDKSGYQWQAWIHNCPFIWRTSSGTGTHTTGTECDRIWNKPGDDYVRSHPGVCEHGKDLFLPWHRAQFYYFETLLRDADPDGSITDSRNLTGPGTKDVTVPYWNWTAKPSGERYPKALEAKDSPLYHEQRNHGKLTPSEEWLRRTVTNPLAVAEKTQNPDWPVFGGYAQEAPVGGYGDFESVHHNPMHSNYFGGDMRNPATAALDPGFFNFHAFIDLIFDVWIEEHGPGAITSKNHHLRADQPTSVTPAAGHRQGAGLPNMGQVSIYFDSAALGYGYEIRPKDRFPSQADLDAVLAGPEGSRVRFGQTAKSVFARTAGNGLYNPAAGPPTMIGSVAVSIPETVGGPNSVYVKLTRGHGADVSYLTDVYLHPDSVSFDPSDMKLRDQYVVKSSGYWGRNDGEVHHSAQYIIDLSSELHDLIMTSHAGQRWRATVVVSGAAPTTGFATVSLEAN
jgi:tyrosinase